MFEDVVGEQSGDEFAAAGHAALGEDRLDVVVDGVARDAHLGGDLFGRQSPGEEWYHFGLSLGEAVGLDDDGDEGDGSSSAGGAAARVRGWFAIACMRFWKLSSFTGFDGEDAASIPRCNPVWNASKLRRLCSACSRSS